MTAGADGECVPLEASRRAGEKTLIDAEAFRPGACAPLRACSVHNSSRHIRQAARMTLPQRQSMTEWAWPAELERVACGTMLPEYVASIQIGGGE